MYGMFGGCTTLWHLALRQPIAIAALTLAGFVSLVPANPGPGDRLGTNGYLTQVSNNIIKAHPELATKVVELQADFDRLDPNPTEEQVRHVLSLTDQCTDVSPRDILADPALRREAARLLYLDTYAREGPKAAEQIFKNNSPPRK